MRLHIYCEGDRLRGLGHLVRCMAYACAWRASHAGEVSWFVDGDEGTRHYLVAEAVAWGAWQQALPMRSEAADVALVDSYSATEAVLRAIASSYSLVVYLDDTFRLAYPRGLVVHAAPDIEESGTGEAHWLRGPSWQPLRPAFWALPADRVVAEQVSQILIIMGGTDPRNLLLELVRQAQDCFPQAHIHAVLGAGRASELPGLTCHRQLDDQQMASLMRQCDLAISAAGQTTYELLATRLPAVLIQVADNQANQLTQWHRLGVFLSAGSWDAPDLHQRLQAQLQHLARAKNRQACLQAMGKIACGQGAPNLVRLLLDWHQMGQVLLLPEGELVPFCRLSQAQALEVLALRNAPEVASQMIRSTPIAPEEHLGFVDAQRQDCFNVNYALYQAGHLLGVVALQRIDWRASQAWLDIYKNVHLAQGGLGRRLLDAIQKVAFECLGLSELRLQVKQDNRRAMAFYQARGFKCCGETEVHGVKLVEMKNEPQ